MSKPMPAIFVDRRALKALFDTYWTSADWRDERSRAISPADFEYAKSASVMFDSIPVIYLKVTGEE